MSFRACGPVGVGIAIYVWETLESEPKAVAIEILAKLIARAAADNHAQEENHE